MSQAMSDSRVVMDEAAVDQLQKLKNGFVRQVLAKLGEVLADRQPDSDGH